MTTDPVDAPVRVLIVDDDQLVRSGLRLVLRAASEIEVVGEAADGAAAVEAVRAHHPDVVLMDVQMPGVGGIEAAATIVAQTDSLVLAMTSFDSEDQLLRMLTAGAASYLLKDDPPARIVEAVRRTARGDTFVSGRSAAQLVRRAVESEGGAQRKDAVARVAVLTERELDVARGVASGATNQEIGVRLHISAGTVKTHLEQVFAKLGARNRVQVGVILERAGMGPAEV